MAKEIRGKKKSNALKGLAPTPWRFDETNNTIVSVPTGEVIFELNIHPRNAQDMAHVGIVIFAMNSEKRRKKGRKAK